MYKYLLVILVISLLAGCGPVTQVAQQEPLATPSGDWTSIKMIQTGGIMGMMRSIEVQRNGAITVVDERANKTVNGELTTTDLSELIEMVGTFTYVPPEAPGGACADCFIYTIEITSPAGTNSYQTDDVGLSNSGMDALVVFLSGTMDAALK